VNAGVVIPHTRTAVCSDGDQAGTPSGHIRHVLVFYAAENGLVMRDSRPSNTVNRSPHDRIHAIDAPCCSPDCDETRASNGDGVDPCSSEDSIFVRDP
jgi:hypothetical protein